MIKPILVALIIMLVSIFSNLYAMFEQDDLDELTVQDTTPKIMMPNMSFSGSMASMRDIELMQLQLNLMTIKGSDRPDFSNYDLFFKSFFEEIGCQKTSKIITAFKDIPSKMNEISVSLNSKHPKFNFSDLIHSIWLEANEDKSLLQEKLERLPADSEISLFAEITCQLQDYAMQRFKLAQYLERSKYRQYLFKSTNGITHHISKHNIMLFVFCSNHKIFTLMSQPDGNNVFWGFNDRCYTGNIKMIRPMVERMMEYGFKFALFLKPLIDFQGTHPQIINDGVSSFILTDVEVISGGF